MVHESPCFCFVNEGAAKLYDHLVCTICQEIPSKDPVVSNCDHVFCNDCITKLCKSSSTSSWRCPNDRQRLYEWFPLDGVARQIWETVRVACPRKACAWQGDLGQYEHHHKIECTCTAIAETATAFYLQTEIKALKLEKSAWESDKRTLEDTARQLTERVEALQCQLAIPDIPKPKQMEKTAESTTQVLRRSTTQATTQDAMPTIPIVSLQGPEVKEMDDAVVKMHRLAKEGVSQRDRERMFSQMQALRARVTNSIKRSPQASSLVVSTELKMMAVAKTSEIFTRNQIKQMKKWHQQHRAMVLRP